jgi:hypothetical protein
MTEVVEYRNAFRPADHSAKAIELEDIEARFRSWSEPRRHAGSIDNNAEPPSMSTRSSATRLKRLEFRSGPALDRPPIEMCLVNSKAKVLCKMGLGPGENEYFPV